PEEIGGANQHDDPYLDEVDGQHDGENAEDERPGNSVAERLALLVPGQPQHEHGEHHRVIGAEEALERHEHRDCQEIRTVDVQDFRWYPDSALNASSRAGAGS